MVLDYLLEEIGVELKKVYKRSFTPQEVENEIIATVVIGDCCKTLQSILHSLRNYNRSFEDISKES